MGKFFNRQIALKVSIHKISQINFPRIGKIKQNSSNLRLYLQQGKNSFF